MKTAMERRAFRIGFDPLIAAGKRGLHDQQPAPKELRPVQLIDAWVRAVAQDEAPHGRLMYLEAVDAIRLAYPATIDSAGNLNCRIFDDLGVNQANSSLTTARTWVALGNDNRDHFNSLQFVI